ncbi:hypothetical protein D3C79_977770 [compost metagenome]
MATGRRASQRYIVGLEIADPLLHGSVVIKAAPVQFLNEHQGGDLLGIALPELESG